MTNMTNVRQITNICGKVITTYQPKENKKYSSEDIGRYLRKFRLDTSLILISIVSIELLKSCEQIIYICNVPIHDGILAYLAMRLIESSNDYRSKDMTLKDLAKVADMYHGLLDPVEEDDNILGCMTRASLTQFEYNRELVNSKPRTLILYSQDFWQKIPQARFLNIDQILLEITQLNLKEILVYGQIIWGLIIDKQQGKWNLIETNTKIEKLNWFSLENQQKYVRWLSSNYSTFRDKIKRDSSFLNKFSQFKFNPLINTPIIIPDRKRESEYIIPISQLIPIRSTRGLYFDCSDYFRLKYPDNKSNKFREAFGYVFQEYVGLLLKEALKTTDIVIKPEWNYGTKNHRKDSPDWILIRDKTAILIEVKQSCLYLTAKQWGDEEEIRKSIKKTIGEGVEQLWKFESDIQNGNYEKLLELKDIEHFEKLLIIYDKAYFLSSSLMRDVIQEIYPQIPKNYHWHIIDIEEFEDMIGTFQGEIFDILSEKRNNNQYDMMDFREYFFYSNAYEDRQRCNPFLDSIAKQFWHEIGLSDKD